MNEIKEFYNNSNIKKTFNLNYFITESFKTLSKILNSKNCIFYFIKNINNKCMLFECFPENIEIKENDLLYIKEEYFLELRELLDLTNIDEYSNKIFSQKDNIFKNKNLVNFTNYISKNDFYGDDFSVSKQNLLDLSNIDKYFFIDKNTIVFKLNNLFIYSKNQLYNIDAFLKEDDDIFGWIVIKNFNNQQKRINEILTFINHISLLIQLKQHNLYYYFLLKKTESLYTINNQENDIFLGNMGHELRTPINCIKGLIDILKSQNDNFDHKTNEYLNTMETCTDHLVNITNKIVDLSKIKANILKLNYDKCEIKNLCKNINNIYNLKFKNVKDIKFNINCDNNIPILIIDKDKLLQIIINLIDNSIKFTKKGYINLNIKQDVLSSATTKDSINIIIEIEDTGIGINNNDLDKIFSPYKQLNNASNKINQSGLGLGLAITKGIIDLMNGKIKVSSKINEGTIFKIYLNCKIDNSNIILNNNLHDNINVLVFCENYNNIIGNLNHPMISANICNNIKRMIIELENEKVYNYILISYSNLLKIYDIYDLAKINKDKLFIILNDNNLKNANLLYEYNFKIIKNDEFKKYILNKYNIVNKKTKNILLVDDDQNNLLVLKEMINICIKKIDDISISWNIIALNSGDQCIEFLKKNTCDILFLDLMMPLINGFDILTYIKNEDFIKNKPYIIIVTASCSLNDKNKSFDLGCDKYLNKPLSLKMIFNTISLLNN